MIRNVLKGWSTQGAAAAAVVIASIVWFSADSVIPARPLQQYVAKPDDSYAWSVVGSRNIGTTEVLELRLHSQTWRDSLWKHRLFVLKPAQLSTGRQALLVLSGGRWRPGYEDAGVSLPDPEDAELFLLIAERLETMIIVLDQVPFQPLFGLTEDELIAFTLDQYLADGDPEWPLLLPMVKSVVRAMDAGTAAAQQMWNVELAQFTLTGGSKRGWTAWLTAAVDRRVTAIAPIVIDALNMEAHFPYQTATWGAPSARIRPYTERNLHIALSTEVGSTLREIVDPYAYRDAVDIPKLIVNATNDEYFPVGSANLYWEGLKGRNYALYLPNKGHDANDLTRLIPSLRALHRAAAGLEPMPSLSWEHLLDRDIIRLCFASDPAPMAVNVWMAESDDGDFRDERWIRREIDSAGAGYLYEQTREPGAWLAMYLEATFGSGPGRYTLTTIPAVLGPEPAHARMSSATSDSRTCDTIGRY